ncbi:MAG TPA: SAM-dependent methyltransferase, partial [Chitinophagaceae bacterium]
MGTVYMVPSLLAEDSLEAIPAYVLSTIKTCQVFFVEDERTARRYLKQLSREIVIDDYEWYNMKDASPVVDTFKKAVKEGKNIGIISEAGCPGVADPGQVLVDIAQKMNAVVKPLVGPNSILLALMASGMNGQQFQFVGYLPIDTQQRMRTIKELEAES